MQNFYLRASARTGSLLLLLFIFLASGLSAQSIVAKHGRLRVLDGKIVDKTNTPVSLAGNSLFWSNAGNVTDFYKRETVDILTTQWNSSIVRAAIGVKETWDGGRGYVESPTLQLAKATTIIDAAIANGIYVIVDWHTHEAERYQAEAITFFSEIARRYGDRDNLIYEVYNEPINQSWTTIRTYAQSVTTAIRKIDPDNLIIVGTPFYSQRVKEAAANPLPDKNTAYTLHFYAGTHSDGLRKDAQDALNSGIALFVTEWGSVLASGKGEPFVAETEKWLTFMRQNKLSHASWAISDKLEDDGSIGANMVQLGKGIAGLRANQLTSPGTLAKRIVSEWSVGTVTPPPPTDACAGNGASISGRIEAESFCRQSGIQTQATSDAGGGRNVGFIDQGDYLDYRLSIPTAGTYTLSYRVASLYATGQVQFRSGSTVLATTSVPNTGGWQNWRTVTTSVRLAAGSQTLRLYASGPRWNINWFTLATAGTTTPPPTGGTTACSFGAPTAGALPALDALNFSKVYVLGSGGPALRNFQRFSINYSAQYNSVYEFAINTTDGKPGYYIDLKSALTARFKQARPELTLSGSGIVGLDGNYWIVKTGVNVALVEKTRGFTLYFSNSATAPACSGGGSVRASTVVGEETVSVFPNPVREELTVTGLFESAGTYRILDVRGATVRQVTFAAGERLTIGVRDLAVGTYLLRVEQAEGTVTERFVRQ